jgi:hypothetical protein
MTNTYGAAPCELNRTRLGQAADQLTHVRRSQRGEHYHHEYKRQRDKALIRLHPLGDDGHREHEQRQAEDDLERRPCVTGEPAKDAPDHAAKLMAARCTGQAGLHLHGGPSRRAAS